MIGELDDIRDTPIGDALSEPEPDNERGTATFPLTKGTNIDADGNEREVWYFLHDVSDQDLAEELGLAWAGGLANTSEAATAEATVSESGKMDFSR